MTFFLLVFDTRLLVVACMIAECSIMLHPLVALLELFFWAVTVGFFFCFFVVCCLSFPRQDNAVPKDKMQHSCLSSIGCWIWAAAGPPVHHKWCLWSKTGDLPSFGMTWSKCSAVLLIPSILKSPDLGLEPFTGLFWLNCCYEGWKWRCCC